MGARAGWGKGGIAAALLGLLAACVPGLPEPPPPLHGVVSIDYCADQMVLGLLPPGQVRAVSHEAASDIAFSAPRARALPRIRPRLEEILALRPAIVMRSYGGAAGLDRQLAANGVQVVQLHFADSLAEVTPTLRRVGLALGAERRAAALAQQFAAQHRAARRGVAHPPRLLYLTPGNVTAGGGTFVADVMVASGWTPYRREQGWGALPLEQILADPPAGVLRAFYEDAAYQQDHWAASAHLVLSRLDGRLPTVDVPGSWLACGNWLAGHAVARLAAARRGVTP